MLDVTQDVGEPPHTKTENGDSGSIDDFDGGEFLPGVETLAGDLTEALVNRVRDLETPYKQLPEAQQDYLIGSLRGAVRHFITKTVQVIAADERATIVGTLEQVVVKDGFKAVIKMPKTAEHWPELVQAEGLDVLVVVADKSKFLGGDDPKPDPDECPLFDDTGAGRDDASIAEDAANMAIEAA